MSGLFIVFEGGDGVGKSTQVDRLVSWLAEQGRGHVVTRQPGGTAVGAELRQLVLHHRDSDISPRAEALIYAADKAQHVDEVIRPALARGDVVVSDRYVDSMIAYQGAGRDLAVQDVTWLTDWATGGLRPDLTIVLDAEPADAVAAIADKDRLEGAGEDFHQRARRHFLLLASQDPGRYLVLDARRSRDELSAEITERIRQLLLAG